MERTEKFRLKRSVKMDMIENKVYLVSKKSPDRKYAYLDPMAALVVEMLNRGKSLTETVQVIDDLLHCGYENAEEKVNNILFILRDYLTKESGRNTQSDIDIKNMLREGSREFDLIVPRMSVPKKISFNLTEYCPRQCIYCFNGAKCSSGINVSNTFLTPARFQEVIDEVIELGIPFVEVGGGDPLVNPDILEYIRILSVLDDSRKGISTKAYVSPKLALQLRENGLTEIQVSLDSLDEKMADQMMGIKGSYREVMESIKNLRAVGINVGIKAVITSLNVYGIPRLFQYFIDEGIKKILFNYYNFSANRHSKKFFPSNDQLAWLKGQMESLLIKAEEQHVYTDYRNIYYEDIRSSGCSMELKNYTRNQCGGMKGEFTVRYDGKVIFCPTICYCDDFVVGDLKRDSIRDVWNSSVLAEWDQPESKREKYKGTECYSCPLYAKCHFRRCYIRQYDANKNFFSKDPLCPYGDPDYAQFME